MTAVPPRARAGTRPAAGIDRARRSSPPRRRFAQWALGTAASVLGWPATAQPAAAVRVGYALARTGPWALGAQADQEQNYLLWAALHNAQGGLKVGKRRLPIALIGIDDTSDTATCLRAYEQLIRVDRVDLLLPPWGSNASFVVAPLANQHRHALLMPTVGSRRLLEFKLPHAFMMLQQPSTMCAALVDLLKAQGVRSLGVIYDNDLFGVEYFAGLRTALIGSGIALVERQSVESDESDLRAAVQSVRDRAPEAFVVLTYPRHSLQIAQQAAALGFKPAVFFIAIGPSSAGFRAILGPALSESMMAMGSWNARTSAGARNYTQRYLRQTGRPPSHWSAGHGWAGLEILTAAVAEHGLDRDALRQYIATTAHDTMLGRLRFSGSELVSMPGTVGQWQQGEFEVIWPPARATAAPLPLRAPANPPPKA